MRFTIIGSRRSENTIDLIEEIERRGHTARTVLLSEIGLLFEKNSSQILWNELSLIDETDIFLFRGFEKNFRIARVLSRTALHSGKTIIDDAVATRDIANKVTQAELFQASGLPHPETFFTFSPTIFENTVSRIGLPLIAKPIDGARGESIFFIRTNEEALSCFNKNAKTHLFQKYIPIQSDIRVFIVGGKVLGAMRRYIIHGDIRSNASLGAESVAIPVTPEIIRLAQQATTLVGYEIAGVDLIETSSGYTILEVNHTPQWQAFKKATNINPAEYIIQYALKKHTTKI